MVWAGFRDWAIPRPAFQATEADLQFLSASDYGEEILIATWNWIKGIKWPDNEVGPLDKVTGISWIKLAMSWMIFTERWVPVIRLDSEGSKRVILIGDRATAQEHGLSFAEAGHCVQKLVRHACGLIPEKIWPTGPYKKTSALYYLGAPKFYQGILRRPENPCQSAVFDMLHQILRTPGQSVTDIPKFEFRYPTVVLPDTYADRHKVSERMQ